MKKYFILTYFCTHCPSIPLREFRSVQAWWSSCKLINARVRGAVRALVSCFKRKRTWRSWHHDLESIRHDLKSLCSENDLRYHMRKIKIISSDWIALLCRLLINLIHFDGCDVTTHFTCQQHIICIFLPWHLHVFL